MLVIYLRLFVTSTSLELFFFTPKIGQSGSTIVLFRSDLRHCPPMMAQLNLDKDNDDRLYPRASFENSHLEIPTTDYKYDRPTMTTDYWSPNMLLQTLP